MHAGVSNRPEASTENTPATPSRWGDGGECTQAQRTKRGANAAEHFRRVAISRGGQPDIAGNGRSRLAVHSVCTPRVDEAHRRCHSACSPTAPPERVSRDSGEAMGQHSRLGRLDSCPRPTAVALAREQRRREPAASCRSTRAAQTQQGQVRVATRPQSRGQLLPTARPRGGRVLHGSGGRGRGRHAAGVGQA